MQNINSNQMYMQHWSMQQFCILLHRFSNFKRQQVELNLPLNRPLQIRCCHDCNWNSADQGLFNIWFWLTTLSDLLTVVPFGALILPIMLCTKYYKKGCECTPVVMKQRLHQIIRAMHLIKTMSLHIIFFHFLLVISFLLQHSS